MNIKTISLVVIQNTSFIFRLIIYNFFNFIIFMGISTKQKVYIYVC